MDFVDNIRKLRRRASAKLLQTLLTIGEWYIVFAREGRLGPKDMT